MPSLVTVVMVLMTGFVVLVPLAMVLVAATGFVPRGLAEPAATPVPVPAQSSSLPRT